MIEPNHEWRGSKIRFLSDGPSKLIELRGPRKGERLQPDTQDGSSVAGQPSTSKGTTP